MMKHEFIERVNAIRAQKGYSPISDIPADDYKVVEYVYTFHPAFDVPDAKGAIAEVYTIQRAVVNGMFIIRSMIPGAKKAEELDKKMADVRRRIEFQQKELEAIRAELQKIREGEV